MILESQTFLVTVGGMGGKLVNETLLLPSMGVALLGIDACPSIGRSVVFKHCYSKFECSFMMCSLREVLFERGSLRVDP